MVENAFRTVAARLRKASRALHGQRKEIKDARRDAKGLRKLRAAAGAAI
jgi:hypothetical protein